MSTTRKRARTTGGTITGTGGGVVIGGANIDWGPNFGKTADDTFAALAAANLDDIELAGQLAAQGAVDFDALELTGTLSLLAGVNLSDLTLSGGADAQAALSRSLDLVGAVGSFAAVDLWSVESSYSIGSFAAADLAAADLDGAVGSAAASSGIVAITDMIPQEDTWLDQANGATSHGADTALNARQANALGNQARNAYVAWDLTGISGTALDGAEFEFWLRRTTGLIDANMNWQVYSHPTQPFEEDTATWDADEPPPGTLETSGSFNNIGTTLEQARWFPSTAQMQELLGNWVYFRFIGETGLGNTTNFEIISKENATTADRPTLFFEMSI